MSSSSTPTAGSRGVTDVLDIELKMRGIEHEWHGKSDLCCASEAPPDHPRQQTTASLSEPVSS